MKSLVLALILAFSAQAQAEVLGFQAWKKERADEARTNLEKLQSTEKAPVGRKPTDQRPAKNPKLQQATLSVEIAQELSVNDYFVLYLSQFKTRDAFAEAAKKLSPEEMGDLMVAYQKHLAGVQEVEALPSTSATR